MNANIVVVEEDARGHGLLARWLANAGYQVREAATAAEACRRIAARTPDLVVIDAGTAYRTGLELVAALLCEPTLPAARALVITSDGALAAYAEDLGAEYLPRPVLRERLLAAVARALDAPATASYFEPLVAPPDFVSRLRLSPTAAPSPWPPPRST